MDELRNPYSPNAGAPPPALVGRDALIERFRVTLGRTLLGNSSKSLLPTGIRGVGKTVLLNRAVEEARKQGFSIAQLEASDSGDFLALLTAQLRPMLFSMDTRALATSGVKAALRALKSFSLAFDLSDLSLKLGIDAEKGVADSGILTVDLIDLFVKLGEAAKEQGTAILIAIDEVQYLDDSQLEAIIMAVHRVTQLVLPLVVIGTGLPQLPALAGTAKSYAERLFDYPNVGPLSSEQAMQAIREPARKLDVDFDDDALDRLYEITKGYPFFIQEWAYHAWNSAHESPIRKDDINRIAPLVLERLDEGFFRVRFDRLTPRERNYLRAMAELSPGPVRSGDVATLLNVKGTSLGPLRSGLIKKGMIYSRHHGDNEFTVPLFDDFMKRTMPMVK